MQRCISINSCDSASINFNFCFWCETLFLYQSTCVVYMISCRTFYYSLMSCSSCKLPAYPVPSCIEPALFISFPILSLSRSMPRVNLHPFPFLCFAFLSSICRVCVCRCCLSWVPCLCLPSPPPLRPQGAAAVSLSEVMSVEELLCPLGGNRDGISANVRGLRGACRNGGAVPSGE